MNSARELVFVNNSRETFTPTASGAIATCIVEVGRIAGLEGPAPAVISRNHARAETGVIDWPSLHLVEPLRAEQSALRTQARRVRRRFNGWARPDQWEYANSVLPLVRDLAPSVVVVNNDPEIAVFLRRKLPGVRVVHWFHNLELCSDRFRHRFAADQGIVSIAVSRYLARALEQVYGMTPLSVHVSHNGVDTSRFALAERPDRLPTIGYLGRVAIEKGADTLLRAAILLRQRGVDFAVQLVGDTNWGETNDNPYSRMVWRLAESLGDSGVEVRRLGHVARANVPAALAQSDVHVIPSRWDEPCALTLGEGLASGQAVVASATGGTPEIVGSGGQLFPREDDAALAGLLEPLLTNPGLRAIWASAARSRAEQLPLVGVLGTAQEPFVPVTSEPLVRSQQRLARLAFSHAVLIVAMAKALRSIVNEVRAGGGSYRIEDWLVNYSGGFVRRGLFGELLLAVTPPGATALWLLLAFQVTCYAVVASLILSFLHRADYSWSAIAVACGPAGIAFAAWDVAGGFRKEIVVFASMALLARVWAGALHGWRAATLTAAALILFAVAVFSWEASVFGIPIMIHLLLRDRDLRSLPVSKHWAAAILVALASAGVASGLIARGDTATAARVCGRIVGHGLNPGLCDGAVAALGWSVPEVLQMLTESYPLFLGYVVLFPLAMLPILLAPWTRLHWPWVLATFVIVAPLFVLALDHGRWIHLIYMSASLGLMAGRPDGVSARFWNPVTTILYVAAWGIPHWLPPHTPWPPLGLFAWLGGQALRQLADL